MRVALQNIFMTLAFIMQTALAEPSQWQQLNVDIHVRLSVSPQSRTSITSCWVTI